ncbi:tRNA (adenosine(37)-N6)-threonylcarbamoyltransferase complex ATPase subunit type 1 TsaE [Nocardioides lianchengensis]|uniref:tRNA threonylcarbamoyladenosine biosynthesis protein TsaE n=1 Tax=Nocardioides lianchengensis TaxID=1045774 RepID=A0A1G6IKF5_9ACTN|nr:tRNA (adenosine(37)-N6)-threonylcarbamoyltransferase complex ATPase subunit type 1 TsaE [Nocardioides lianchengensis]NYG13027.1 tRNA threonylcarbamoyl adenosine modification protein YjeE [Nocardioides lianchengensis]SDC06485.1 tRNA threonylcarbamoyl adenosine modification protein YjeE [Nocardioides lianchengensis]
MSTTRIVPSVHRVGPEAAAEVLGVVREAFAARPPLDPPADALTETEESLAALLGKHGGLVARLGEVSVGALVLDPIGGTMYLRRFGVLPSAQGHGVAGRLIDAAVYASSGFDDLTVVAREELPRTVRFWQRQGFREVRRHSPNVELRRPLNTFVFDAPDAEAMREIGETLAAQLAAGDLLVLSGELGAGKTTFTQGIGTGLQVRGDVTSPTFVIARVHPSLVDGPALVHVDAYRLGGIEELDDLDLDTSLDEAVTVVEWGEGVAEGLAESRLEVRIIRALADDDPDLDDPSELDPRRVLMTPVGPRWYELDVPSSHRPPLAEKLNENLLLDFRRCPEAELDHLDPEIPLVLSLTVAEHRDGSQVRALMVRNHWSREWELSGKEVDDDLGETPRRAATTAYLTETGAEAPELDFVGVATVQLGHERRIEYAAIYRCVIDHPSDAAPAGDVKQMVWWDLESDLPGLSPIDAHLARLALGLS